MSDAISRVAVASPLRVGGVTIAPGKARIDEKPLPIYPVLGADLGMTYNRLRWLAIAVPIVMVGLLEVIRAVTIGSTTMQNRIILDVSVAGVFIIFSFIMVRAISRAHRRLERQNAELLALHGASLDVTAELSLESVLDKVVERARALVGARYGALSIVDSENRIKAFITSGITTEERTRIGDPPVGHGLLGVVLNHGEHLRLADLTHDARSEGFPPHHPPMRSLLAVPINCKSPFRGNLYLAEKEGTAEFTTSDEETLVRFAVQAAIAIDNAHLHQEVADLAVARERLHIAHEMHDGISQVLGYVNTKVQAANEYLRLDKPEQASAQLRELAVAAREAYGDVRDSIIDLRTLPEPERHFSMVLEEYLDRWRDQTGISTRLTMDSSLNLPTSAELQLVRIIQESLANIRKHAKATTARVEVRQREGILIVTVTDDGVGFDQERRVRSEFPRFGLATMNERAASIGGTFVVESTPGRGTSVRVTIPVTSA